jgi:hypothetical protein
VQEKLRIQNLLAALQATAGSCGCLSLGSEIHAFITRICVFDICNIAATSDATFTNCAKAQLVGAWSLDAEFGEQCVTLKHLFGIIENGLKFFFGGHHLQLQSMEGISR